LILTYVPYMAALIVCGLGLRLGIFPGPAPFGLTVVPAIIAAILTAIGVSTVLVPTDLQRRLEGFAARRGRIAVWAQRLANLPASASAGMRDALTHLRHPDPALGGAVLFWAFQVAVLWASFRAFGDAPPLAVLTQAFFVGMFGNLLPMPGGVGGVEGGMIAALAAFGVDAGQAVVAVLLFRGVTFWLPLLPGVIAYFQLRKTVEGWRRERIATA
jgi:Lysylphosphatidylglycerol synthase TM region